MRFFCTGDTHGKVLERLHRMNLLPGDAAIILGDAGLNFYLNKTDEKNKREVNDFLKERNCYLYCVRGNHEERPENLKYAWFHDSNVNGKVRIEMGFPKIRYLMDGEEYVINYMRTLVIGGAYSVDKYHRLNGKDENTDKWTGWFKDEQLSKYERDKIFDKIKGKNYDVVLTHTCPVEWMPTDLFLSQVDQSKVDKTMEVWLSQIKDEISWKVWLFGHYHADRIIRPRVEMMYTEAKPLKDIYTRWSIYDDKISDKEWWLLNS